MTDIEWANLITWLVKNRQTLYIPKRGAPTLFMTPVFPNTMRQKQKEEARRRFEIVTERWYGTRNAHS